MERKEAFIKWCKSKGIESVNEHSVFRWDEVIDFAEEKTKQQQEIIDRLKIKLENMVYYANQLEEASDKLWLKSFKVATVEAESILKELE